MTFLKLKVKTFVFKVFINIAKLLNIYIGNENYGFIYSGQDKLKENLMNYYYDIDRYLIYSTQNNIPTNEKNLISRIIAHYHIIEKGLSMPVTKSLFGEDVAKSLILLCKQYIELNYNVNYFQFQVALKILGDYRNFSMQNNGDEDFYHIINELRTKYQLKEFTAGGVKKISKSDYLKSTHLNFKEMAFIRCTIRNYNEVPIDRSIIKNCIEIALTTPSVCNRQSWSTISIFDNSTIQNVLSLQNGNRGFGHLIKCLVVVKANLRCFHGIEERNQVFIDCGMFGMNLVYAIQYYDLGSVVLNWASNYKKDNALHKLLGINNDEIVAFFIGIGNLKEKFSVPFSARKSFDEINRII
jgi:nitroreductase